MAKTLSEDAKAGLRKAMDEATQNPQKLPGVVFALTDKTGQDLFSYGSGTIGLDSGEPMTTDTVFWIASCTKMIAAIAAMQLVEQGKISLDDSAAVEKICPELAKMQVLKEVGKDGKPVMEAKKNGITLRMLLTHTAGFGYTFFNHEIRKFGLPVGTDEFSGQPQDVELLPLTFQPGTGWQYGTNIDWAGTIVARISGMSLNEYIQKNICAPLGLKNVNMFPTPEMKARLAHMHQRDASGLRPRDHLNKRPLTCRQDEIKDIYNSAGAGAFAKPVEYVR
jgi:CubicO group peptidase (beta-lactamase class C family)